VLCSGGREEGVRRPWPAGHALMVGARHHRREGLVVVTSRRISRHLSSCQLGCCCQLLVVSVPCHRVVPRIARMIQEAFRLLDNSEIEKMTSSFLNLYQVLKNGRESGGRKERERLDRVSEFERETYSSIHSVRVKSESHREYKL